MEIYLIRHTKPRIADNTCYGQSDIDVCDSFEDDALSIKRSLPETIEKVYSSPLTRCRKLAQYLFPAHTVHYRDELKEIDCGEWELKNWNEIDERQLKNWMNDFVHIPFPKGEGFVGFHKRVIEAFETIANGSQSSIALITHAGVIRSILAHITSTSPERVFDEFKLNYGTVVLLKAGIHSVTYQIISGAPPT